MPSSPTIVQVSLAVSLARAFDYLCPTSASPPEIGARVLVPFGRRKLVGIVTGLTHQSDYPIDKLKSIIDIIDDTSLFSETQWDWLLWASDYYHYPLGEVLMSALPALLRQGRTLESLGQSIKHYRLTASGLAQLGNASWIKRAKAKAPLLQTIADQPDLTHEQLLEAGFSTTLLNSLLSDEWITMHTSEKENDAPAIQITPAPFALNADQQHACQQLSAIDTFQCTVLEGVTGSGKTEVYLQTIANHLLQGHQVLWLEPEIGLTPQMIAHVRKRLSAPLFCLHSGLSDRTRAETWLAIKRCEGPCLVLGTRSAMFAPLAHLKLIIIDESHDSSYQQHSRWQYCARDMCVKLAHMLSIPIILGSATPALATIANIQEKRFNHIALTKRIQEQPMPEWIWEDCRDQTMQAGLTDGAIAAIEATLKHGKQVLVFVNRRGYCHVLRCHHCGFMHECLACNMPMVWHRTQHKMLCHHCGHQEKRLRICPDCQQSELSECGIGTEQVESFLAELFPQTPVLRIDRDEVKTTQQFQSILDEVASDKPMILVGTQMVAKGHHFKSLATVVVVNMDGAFFSGDYEASEKMGQLLLQVAGRAGRDGDRGKVILQTHHMLNPLLQLLVNDGYQAFARYLLEQRKIAHLPPYGHLAYCVVEDTQEQRLVDTLTELKQFLHPYAQSLDANLVGPMPCLLQKKAGKHRYELLIQTNKRSERHQLLSLITQWQLHQPRQAIKVMIRLQG